MNLYIDSYPFNPLVPAFIAQSGSASRSYMSDLSGGSFTYIASKVGCDTSGSSNAIFACMQSKPAIDIIQFHNKYDFSEHDGVPPSLGPTADDQVVFPDDTRQERGIFAQVPTIYSTTITEGSALLEYTPGGPSGDPAAIDAATTRTTCGAATGATACRNSKYLSDVLVTLENSLILIPLPSSARSVALAFL